MRLGYDPDGPWMALCDGSEVLLHGAPLPSRAPTSPADLGSEARQNDAARIMAVVVALAVVAFFVVSAFLWIAGIL